MAKTGKAQNNARLIRILRKVGREAFARGYGFGRESEREGYNNWFNTVALRDEYDRLVAEEVRRGRKI